MPLDIIIGAQWGDEGKGRITDLMARQAAIVARFSGGDNAGHTVAVGDETFKLHLIPSGIIHSGVLCLIGNGTVVNPAVLLREMDGLAERGLDVGPARLKICRNAHLITPAHIALDKAKEAQRGDDAIGTTQRGIGPAYTDKTSRHGLRANILLDPDRAETAVREHINRHNQTLTKMYNVEPLDADQIATEFRTYAERLAPHLVNGAVFLDQAMRAGSRVLAEGAQGTMLDIDHGTYPFVTSSSPTAGGALTGLGLGPKVVDRVMGVAKAFSSRVGSGPFATELSGEDAVRLRGTGSNPWDEFGTTTGRPRRVGWLDLVVLRHAVRVNSISELCLTKLDILSGIEEIPVCVGYDVGGERVDYLPPDLETLVNSTPIYETLPGWTEDITGARTTADLPENTRRYIEYVSEALGVPTTFASVGPVRDQVVDMRDDA